MAKMLIDVQRGVIEVEGDEEFVERVYTDVKDTMIGKLDVGSPADAPPPPSGEAAAEEAPRKGRRKPKSAGPSCPSRIEALKAEGFFADLRTAKDIGKKLREKGTAYEAKRVASALSNLTASGRLRRIEEDGVWKYQNP